MYLLACVRRFWPISVQLFVAYTPVCQSWHVASQQSWSKSSRLLHRIWGMTQERVYRVPIRDTDEWYGLLRYGPNFSTAWWAMRLINEKMTRSVSPCSLKTCCDVACPTFNLWFKLPQIRTGCFQATNIWRKTIYLNLKFKMDGWTSPVFHKIVWWHFSDVVKKLTVTLTILFYSEITQIIRSTY